jgi:hypothetical protein
VMVDAGIRATGRVRAAKVASIEKCGGPLALRRSNS